MDIWAAVCHLRARDVSQSSNCIHKIFGPLRLRPVISREMNTDAIDNSLRTRGHRFNLRHPPLYSYPEHRQPTMRRRKRSQSQPVPVNIVGARVSGQGLVEFEVVWQERLPVGDTWVPEASMMRDHKTLVDIFMQQQDDRDAPAEVLREGLRNARVRRIARIAWTNAEWARMIYQAEGDEARAAVIERCAQHPYNIDSRSVHLRVCYCKVESLDV